MISRSLIPAAPTRRTTALWALGAGVAAILVGIGANFAVAPLIGFVTLLPLLSHVRWVGVRRALTEPTAATIVLYFYVVVFPLRGLAIIASDFQGIALARGTVTTADVVALLLLASAGTTVFVEAFHFVRTRRGRTREVEGTNSALRPIGGGATDASVTMLAVLMSGVALVALALLISQSSGLGGAQARFLSHSKEEALIGSRSAALSIWALFAVPAVWCVSCAVLNPRIGNVRRVILAGTGVIILVAELVVFGSRLSVILGLSGTWVIWYYSRRSVPTILVLIAVPLIIIISVPILEKRSGGDVSRLPAYERYAQIAGYSVLDVALAVRQQPQSLRLKLSDPNRWTDLPLYLLPAAVFKDRPNIEPRRLDVYVAQALGNQNQQNAGYPTSYLSEMWLYGGWLAVVGASALLGALAGWLHRALVGRGSPSPSAMLWYCFVVTCTFSYYKDGDVLTNFLGDTKRAFYLALAMLATGVWPVFAARRHRLPDRADIPAARLMRIT